MGQNVTDSRQMSLLPNQTELVARARADLRMGVPVVIDGTLAFAAETLSAERLAALRLTGVGRTCRQNRHRAADPADP